MSFYKKLIRLGAASLLVVAVTGLAFADTVRLKDGSIIKGKIVSFGGGKFVVAMGEGSRRREMSFTAGEVDSITFDDETGTQNRNASFDRPTAPTQPVKTVDDGSPAPRTGETLKPISWQIKVLADNTSNGWTNTGWVVKKGQRIRISGDGEISLGGGRSTTASGSPSIEDPQRLLKNVATGALIAVIGDDNNDFIYIGATREIVATRDGALFLGINEGQLDDNSGHFNVKVEIIPE
jgi:hypothetical protein